MQAAGGNSANQSIKVAYPLQLLQGDLAHLLGGSQTLEQALLGGVQNSTSVTPNLNILAAPTPAARTPNAQK